MATAESRAGQLAVVLLLTACIAPGAEAAPGDPDQASAARLPDVIERVDAEGFRVWVGARAATLDDGSVDLDLVSRPVRRGIEKSLSRHLTDEAGDGECNFGIIRAEGGVLHPLPAIVGELARESPLVLSGAVQEVAAGLFHGRPGSLVLVSVTARHKGDWPEETVIALVPTAKLRFRGRTICFSADAPLPATRAEALIFVWPLTPPEPAPEILPEGTIVLFRGEDAQVRGPRQLVSDPAVAALRRSSPLATLVTPPPRASE